MFEVSEAHSRNSLALRPASATDLGVVLTWFSSEAELHAFAGRQLEWPLSPEQLSEYQRKNGLRASVVVMGPKPERVLGHFDLRAMSESLHLGRVAVSPAWRRKGIGRFIVEAAKVRLSSSGLKRLTLNVAENNVAARELYRRSGFIEDGSEDGVVRMAFQSGGS